VTDGWPEDAKNTAPTAAADDALATATLETKAGKSVSASEALAGKTVVLYFSAHWCPPCRAFTPQLAKA
jgi:thiol-disulfide isomerase/thioredoxin